MLSLILVKCLHNDETFIDTPTKSFDAFNGPINELNCNLSERFVSLTAF